MKIRYGNDLALTERARLLTNQMEDLNILLRDGRLDLAYTMSEMMKSSLEDLMYRLNDLRFEREIGSG